MDRSQVVSLTVAMLCLATIGVSATTLGSTVETRPDDVIDLDLKDLPIGQGSAEEIDRELDANRGTDGEAPAGNTGSENDAGNRNAESDSGGQEQSDDPNAEQIGEEGAPKEVQKKEPADEGEPSQAQKETGGQGEGAVGGVLSLLDRLLSLLKSLLPYLIVVVVVATIAGLTYRYRERLLALVAVPFGTGPPGENGTTDTDPWADVTPKNDVDRAWYQMVRHLNVEKPWARTPDECRQQAVADGLDPGAVATITETFREVRYADGEPTTTQKQRVRESLDELDLRRGSI